MLQARRRRVVQVATRVLAAAMNCKRLIDAWRSSRESCDIFADRTTVNWLVPRKPQSTQARQSVGPYKQCMILKAKTWKLSLTRIPDRIWPTRRGPDPKLSDQSGGEFLHCFFVEYEHIKKKAHDREDWRHWRHGPAWTGRAHERQRSLLLVLLVFSRWSLVLVTCYRQFSFYHEMQNAVHLRPWPRFREQHAIRAAESIHVPT